MAKYVDGFVITIPKKNVASYKKMAQIGKKIWMKHGALEYFECIGQDLKPKGQPGMPPVLSFPKMTGAKPNETVAFSFIVFKSRTHRDQVNAKVMKDPAMNDPKWETMPMPFEMKNMAYGGFDVIVEG